MSNRRSIFLTGVTGTLGKELIRYFLEKTDAQLFLLIRRKNRFSHWDRARKILKTYGLETHLGIRVQVMDGDVTLSRLGLNQDDFDILKQEVREFFHIAALTALNGSREDCFRVNLGGKSEKGKDGGKKETVGDKEEEKEEQVEVEGESKSEKEQESRRNKEKEGDVGRASNQSRTSGKYKILNEVDTVGYNEIGKFENYGNLGGYESSWTLESLQTDPY